MTGDKISAKVVGKRKYITLGIAFLLVGIIAASLIYRGNLIGKITGNAVVKDNSNYITEQQASNKLLNYYNIALKGGVTFVRSQDLVMVYEVVLEKEKQQQVFYITKDGKYLSLIELPDWVNVTLDNP